jgi:lysophospholipase L1-like esterase
MFSYLALGDSYTIGEGVLLSETWPYQFVQLLRKTGHAVHAPEIIARTGWTTDELAHAIAQTRLLPHYDIITLLIGVNNQYRGRDLQEYGEQFEKLLHQAIRLAQPAGKVFVLSIPDWGVSPFAAAGAKDSSAIATAINSFNTLAQQITAEQGLPFIDITTHGRIYVSPADFAADGLHPGAAQYAGWAKQLADAFRDTPQ